MLGLVTIQLLLSACSHQALRTDTQTAAAWPDHQAKMLALSNWHIKGKIGYKNASKGGSAWLDWRQNLEQFKLVLSGPLGAGTVQIFGDNTYATLRQTDASDISATSAAALSRKLLGWGLPVDELAYWIRGIPAPNVPVNHQTFNDLGLLASLEQGAWLLEFSKYRLTDTGRLPARLSATSLLATNSLGSQEKTHFKLIIKEQIFNMPVTDSVGSPDSDTRQKKHQQKTL